MEYLVRDLQGGQGYVLQIRAVSADGFSEWSPAYPLTAPADDTIPDAPTGLTVVTSGSTYELKWVAPFFNTDGSSLKDLAGYEITIDNGGGSSYVQETTSKKFGYTIALNALDFGVPIADANFSVKAKDKSGNLSAAVTGSGTFTTPGNPVVYANGGINSITVSWNPVDGAETYKIYMDTTPAPTNHIGSTASTNFTITVDDLLDRYIRVTCVDAFGQESSGDEVTSHATPYPTDAFIKEYILADGPFLYWTASEGATPWYDYAGNGWEGTLSAATYEPTSTPSPYVGLGKLANWYVDSADNVTLGSDSTPASDLLAAGDFSLEGWFRVNTSFGPGTGDAYLTDDEFGVMQLDGVCRITVDDTNNKVRVEDLSGGKMAYLDSGTIASYSGGLHHIVMTYDSATGDNKLYVDKVLVDSGSGTGGDCLGPASDGVSRLWTMDSYIAPSSNVDYDMAHIAFYHSELTLAQIEDHYDAKDGALGGGGGGGSTTLAGLTDVNLTSPADKSVLRYDSGSSKWIDDPNYVRVDTTGSSTLYGLTTVSPGGASLTATYQTISGVTLDTGSYLVQIDADGMLYTGSMSWKDGSIAADDNSEIVLHRAGSGGSSVIIYSRTFGDSGTSSMKFQLACASTLSVTSLTLRFRRIF